MTEVELELIAVGGNRHPSAADWVDGLLAFGAGNSIALWNPDHTNGIFALLKGHTDAVNAVRVYEKGDIRCLISGSSDKTIRMWRRIEGQASFKEQQTLTGHEASINGIAILPEHDLFATASADGTVKLWRFAGDQVELAQTISLKPRYIPMTVALASLPSGDVVLAVAGTSSIIQLFSNPEKGVDLTHQATLTGHEGWLRSLDFALEKHNAGSDLLLASASQDKYIRLWRLKPSEREKASDSGSLDILAGSAKKSLSNKAQRVGSQASQYTVTFEALLIGHEDWIYTARWGPRQSPSEPLILMSASADNSVSMWSADEASGLWVCDTRLGEISAQKGSTTATGSTGGFWIGLWSPDGRSVVSLGRTGSWRRWTYDQPSDMWMQQLGIGGHTKDVQSVAWAPDGSYLLSTGLDQTTRLLAEWKRDSTRSWHEFARPQIHGYDLNCIDTLTSNQFVSGADEKLLRVFNKPKAMDSLLAKLSGSKPTINGDLADAASIPVLGLSNKAVAATDDDTNGVDNDENGDVASVPQKSTLDLDHPPFEDHLARHTLWPEHEKLYGHGYEISAAATSPDGSLIATASKASTIDHAVIRLFETREWREVKPPLAAHTLTVTALAFSGDSQYLLSVGRDRQLAVFARSEELGLQYQLLVSNPKAHSRMVLDCSWAPTSIGAVFATAGRDKNVKIWRLEGGNLECVSTVAAAASVTAVAFALRSNGDGGSSLAYGTETGEVAVLKLSENGLQVVDTSVVSHEFSPAAAITELAWRPEDHQSTAEGQSRLLAIASEDCSVRMLKV
ncbi:hypothetical protein MBLNU230_g6543t1 [Neophaeotheca triangularis]